MEFCLGTVQFGLDYGIAGGKRAEVAKSIETMLLALDNGVTTFDTACAYGIAEEIVGGFLRQVKNTREKLNIITKTPPNILDGVEKENYFSKLSEALDVSLGKLGQEYVDCFMFHTSSYVTNEYMVEALYRLKETGKAKRIGASIYTVEEALAAANNQFIDNIQIPYNIADSRLDEAKFFSAAKDKTIFARSAFLQGLLLMPIDNIPDRVREIKPYLLQLDNLLSETDYSRLDITVAYMKQHKSISYLVFGVDTQQQLMEILKAGKNVDSIIMNESKKIFNNIDNYILNPSLWRK